MSDRLYSLSSRVEEQLRQFTMEEEDRTGRKIVGAAAAGAGAAGAYKLHQAAMNRAGAGGGSGMIPRQGRTASAYKKAAEGFAGDMKGKARGVAGDALGKGSSLLRKGAGVLAKGRKKLYGLEETVDRIVHLASAIETLDFEEKQRNPLGVAYAGAMGTGYPGAAVALTKRKKFKDSGLVYRKRDALKDSAKGSLAATGAVLGTAAGALGLGSLAAKRKLPKGLLRKAGVKTGQFIKKAAKDPALARKAGIGLGLGAGLTGASVQNASANKRYKERMRQRLEGGEG
jgi:hypothetical protein